jgi:hypothetical protein
MVCIASGNPADSSRGTVLTLVRAGVVERMFRSHLEDLNRLVAAYTLGTLDRTTCTSEVSRIADILWHLIQDGPAERALRHADEVILNAILGDDPLPPDPAGPEEMDQGEIGR